MPTKIVLGLALGIWSLIAPVTVQAPNVVAPNINSQQTAYYDYQGGPRVVKIDYKPIKTPELPIDKSLWDCPELITRISRCVFHNSPQISNSLEGRYETN